MNADVVSAIKDVATGLRPAMLDDLGLGPAIRAHAREVSRRTGVPVDVRLDGEVDRVPEPHRTHVFRIVQEALHNCARHARASHVIVSLYGRPNLVSVAVQDDGVGFDATRPTTTGLGLYGMKERVRDLRGRLNVTSTPGAGTLLEVELPLMERAES
jgi:signal transduction histidine kinase